MIRDSNKKVSSEFPFGSRKTKKFSKLNDFPEVIEEDKKEEEKQVRISFLCELTNISD